MLRVGLAEMVFAFYAILQTQPEVQNLLHHLHGNLSV